MNRPIKFRGYYDGEIYEVTEIFWSDGTASLYRSVDQEMRHVRLEEIILLEFTGLHDKNGKEIYEGDVCKVHDFKPEIVEIKWYDSNAGFAGYSVEDDKYIGRNPWLGIHPNHFEVIGNIYENPDLLN